MKSVWLPPSSLILPPFAWPVCQSAGISSLPTNAPCHPAGTDGSDFRNRLPVRRASHPAEAGASGDSVRRRDPLVKTTHEVASALGKAIARRIGESRYQLWFQGRTKFALVGEILTVGVPNRHFEEWLGKNFHKAVADAAAEVCGGAVEVRFVIDPELFRTARREQEEARNPGPEPAPAYRTPRKRKASSGPEDAKPQAAKQATEPPPRPRKQNGPRRNRRWHRLEEFVVGPCNRVAHASALSVVEAPGEGPNPLVLHGPVGTGKTHLLEGIYAGIRRTRSGWRVTYATSEDFTNRFVQAMRLGKLSAFRRYFRDCDVLLLDDLHFLATKKATQEEFLHTFDALLVDGRQLVLTCDCHPRLSEDFTPELTDRLLGGAVWGLGPPDPDTRLGILQSGAARGDVPLPEEVLRFLASQLRGNARELEGALHSLRHYSRVAGRPVDVPLAREALADLLRHAVRVVCLEDVDRVVCAVLRLASGTLQSKARAWAVSHPRMVAMFLARKHTAHSYGEIGAHFGGRNHSTVVAAEKKVRGWLSADGELSLGQTHPLLRVREIIERAERDLFR
jgi:chromosomal replication initiator protein